MSNNKNKSTTQRIKDVLNNGKTITESYAVNKLGASDRFLGKRIAEFRASGMDILTTKNRNKETAYKLAPVETVNA